MPDRTFKLIELVGTSNRSFADACSNAVRKASRTLHGLAWFEVVEQRGAIENGRVKEFQVKLKVAFKLLDDRELGGATGAKKR
ncbi:MAG TPA: dodecin [Candidatus Thermoplasmatota archaeon]|nr:dodecin [Candidatus Thermoplasmatota archaeon]